MPHKHKRRRTDEGASFDLPPTSVAKPLPAFYNIARDDKPKRTAVRNVRGQTNKGPRNVKDDTPRAFARLLNFQTTGKRPTHTLDDGSQKSKKHKREADSNKKPASTSKDAPVASETATATLPEMKILPGERLSDYAARVDQALPIAGLKTKGKAGNARIPGVKTEERKTKHNRRLERMQKEWREEEARRKEKLDEEMEDEEEEREGQQLLWEGVAAGGKKRKKRKGKVEDCCVEEHDDPWAELEEKRRETKQKNLQDVVQAPPQLKGVKGRSKDYGAAVVDVENVPGSVGSLRKREELGVARRSVIDEYRKMMGRQNQVIKV